MSLFVYGTQPVPIVTLSLCMDLRYFSSYMCSVTQLLKFYVFLTFMGSNIVRSVYSSIFL